MTYDNMNEMPIKDGLTPEDKQRIQTIIHSDKSAEVLVRFASEKAQRLVQDKLSATQIRQIFGEIRKIQAFWEKDNEISLRRLRLLQPRLAYQKARKAEIAYFCDIMSEAIDQVFKAPDIQNGFQNCVDLLEALIAYHKSLGGRD